MTFARLATLATACLLASLPATAATLTVEIRGTTQAQGAVLLAVYDQADTWLRTPVKVLRVDAAAGTTVATLEGLPEGAYAISAFQDLNGNNRLDSNEMRVPIEPWGFSNDAIGNFGPASFEAARFTLPAEGARVAISLRS